MPAYLDVLIFFLAGAAIVYLFQVRRSRVKSLSPEDLPELSKDDFSRLIVLLKTAYERMLYMGVLFFPLALSTLQRENRMSTLFFLLLIFLLFLSNIPPRHKIMQLLEGHNLTTGDLKQRGIHL
ncbi:MAG: hypothetical protein CSA34_07040 [Desulfobulbus propionicus]|nr:MAG: hypothetical protein CSA34_07040 [Desulfobulbus propionicus]